MSLSVVYITTGDGAEARRIGRALVNARLVACANIFDGITSVFHWEGEVQENGEAVLIVKTRTELVEAVIERVRELHSYECPAVVAAPIAQGNPDYLEWIARETGG